MIQQNLDYIHENPVNEGIVYEVQGYVYSSARGKSLIPIKVSGDCVVFDGEAS